MIAAIPTHHEDVRAVGHAVVDLLWQKPDQIDMEVWLGLGSNLQQPAAQLRRALKELMETKGIELTKVSSFYSTPPWGDQEQGDFVNAVAQIETSLEPLPLLHVVHSIENLMGRERSDRRWGPRLIDIDLLLYADHVIYEAELEIPHPRMHERAFVLLPLCELDETLKIPGRGRVDVLLSGINCNGISRLASGDPE